MPLQMMNLRVLRVSPKMCTAIVSDVTQARILPNLAYSFYFTLLTGGIVKEKVAGRRVPRAFETSLSSGGSIP